MARLNAPGKGYQAADWHQALNRDLPAIRALIDAIAADEAASAILDLDWLRAAVDDWPRQGWHRREVIGKYRTGLLMGLTVGHFMLSARHCILEADR